MCLSSANQIYSLNYLTRRIPSFKNERVDTANEGTQTETFSVKWIKVQKHLLLQLHFILLQLTNRSDFVYFHLDCRYQMVK